MAARAAAGKGADGKRDGGEGKDDGDGDGDDDGEEVPRLKPHTEYVNRFDVRRQYHEKGGIAVPDIGRGLRPLEWRRKRNALFRKGVYPGEEYRILGIYARVGAGDKGSDVEGRGNGDRVVELESFLDASFPPGIRREDVRMQVRPNYPLVEQLERDWPVEIKLVDVPHWEPRSQYYRRVVLTALGASATLLGLGVLAPAKVVSAYVVPSWSMFPAIHPGDTLLVEKVTAQTTRRAIERQEMIMFFPPEVLVEIEKKQGVVLNPKQAFVKRVWGIPGDVVSVVEGVPYVNGKRAGVINKPIEDPGSLPTQEWNLKETRLDDDSLFVLGDNPDRSVDSRCWGLLPRRNVIGRPFFRCGPPGRIGNIR